MRAPLAEAPRWKPLLDSVRSSLRIEPSWLAAYQLASAERGRTAAEVFRALARVDQEIAERRAKQRSETQHESYLLLSGQEEYLNPFTKEVERDTSEYPRRWVTSAGDRLYTEDTSFDPNHDPRFSKLEWKATPVRPR